MTKVLWILGPLLVSGCSFAVDSDGLHHGAGWRQADLERNRFDLGLSRGADTGEELATWANASGVVASGGSSVRGRGGDLYVVLDHHTDAQTTGFGAHGPTDECWRFTTPDGYAVEFRQVDCP